MGAIVMVTTVGNEEQANLIGREIVARRQAACVNMVPGVRSLYRWQGRVCQDSEYVLMIKTLDREYESVCATIRELHNYELPEILAFQVSRGDEAFLEWIAACVDKDAEFPDEDDDSLALPNPDDTNF
jgi:periplasmic divalent cation tolerance protein